MKNILSSRRIILAIIFLLMGASFFFLDGAAIDNGDWSLVFIVYIFILIAAVLVVRSTIGMWPKLAWGLGSFVLPAFIWTMAWLFAGMSGAMTRPDELYMGNASFTEEIKGNLERDIGLQLSDDDRIIHSSRRVMYMLPEIFYQIDIVILAKDVLDRQGYLSGLGEGSIGPSYRKQHLCTDGETRLKSSEAFAAICSKGQKLVMSKQYQESGPHISANVYPDYKVVWIKITDLP